MRSTGEGSAVRLYRVDNGSGAVTSLFYGTLDEALALGRRQPEAVQDELFVQTRDDVVGFLDLVGG